MAGHGNGWAERLRVAAEFLQKPGNLAIALLAFGGAVYTGYLPSPMTALADQIKRHDDEQARVSQQKLEIDRKVAEALAGITRILTDRDRRDRLRECEALKDLMLRAECLR